MTGAQDEQAKRAHCLNCSTSGDPDARRVHEPDDCPWHPRTFRPVPVPDPDVPEAVARVSSAVDDWHDGGADTVTPRLVAEVRTLLGVLRRSAVVGQASRADEALAADLLAVGIDPRTVGGQRLMRTVQRVIDQHLAARPAVVQPAQPDDDRG